MLASTTASGLQSLIDCADNYITRHGLRFNPSKTKCIIYGANPFIYDPKWHIQGTELQVCSTINYLGSVIGNTGKDDHINARLSSCRKAFFSLQGAGLCSQGLSIETATHVFNATCKSILLYACKGMYLTNKNRKELDKLQGKLKKSIVGLNSRYRTSPLLNALNINSISDVIDFNNVCLLNNIIKTESGARKFYCLMIWKQVSCKYLLTSRVSNICKRANVNFSLSYISKQYLAHIKRFLLFSVPRGNDGLVDTIRHLLSNPSTDNSSLLRLLLKAF